MDGRLDQRDLLAGAAAAAMLLLAVAFDLTIWLAFLLAVIVYAGMVLVLVLVLVLVRSRPAPMLDVNPQHAAYEAARANTEAIRALQTRIGKPEVRDLVGNILDRIADVLAVMREDDNLEAAPLFNDNLVTPVRALLTEYARLSNRGVSSAGDLLEKIETHDLPRIERTLDTFYERLHRAHVIDLAILGEVLELNLDSVDTTSHRRVTP